MREIKFRVWHKKWNKWVHDELDIFINPEGEVIERYDYYYESVMRDISKDVDIVFYTGLKDKNGKEIYEGDICEVEYKSGKKFNNDIRFLNAAFTFRSYYLHRVAEDVLDEFCTIRVVGNIYENPELLEATP